MRVPITASIIALVWLSGVANANANSTYLVITFDRGVVVAVDPDDESVRYTLTMPATLRSKLVACMQTNYHLSERPFENGLKRWLGVIQARDVDPREPRPDGWI